MEQPHNYHYLRNARAVAYAALVTTSLSSGYLPERVLPGADAGTYAAARPLRALRLAFGHAFSFEAYAADTGDYAVPHPRAFPAPAC